MIVFISYSISDSNYFYVKKIANKLEQYPLIEKVYYWERDQTSEQEILEFMEENLLKADLMIAVCSKNYNNSSFCKEEVRLAIYNKIKILPIWFNWSYVRPILQTRIGIDMDPIVLPGTELNKTQFDQFFAELYRLISGNYPPNYESAENQYDPNFLDGNQKFWTLLRTISVPEPPQNKNGALKFSNNGKYLLAVLENTLWVWNINSGNIFRELELPKQRIKGVYFSGDDNFVYCLFQNMLWKIDFSSWSVVFSKTNLSELNDFDPSEEKIYEIEQNALIVSRIKNNNELTEITKIKLPNRIKEFRTKEDRGNSTISVYRKISRLCFITNSKCVAISAYHWLGYKSHEDDGELCVWDYEKNSISKSVTERNNSIKHLTVCQNGTALAYYCEGLTIYQIKKDQTTKISLRKKLEDITFLGNNHVLGSWNNWGFGTDSKGGFVYLNVLNNQNLETITVKNFNAFQEIDCISNRQYAAIMGTVNKENNSKVCQIKIYSME